MEEKRPETIVPAPITAAEPPPIGAEPPKPANPIAKPTVSHTQTLKLKPLIRRPSAEAAAPSAEASKPSTTEKLPAMQQLKGMTQKLKGITQQIPQQAILHKTGIIADRAMSEAQKQAAKSRTARISLSDAIGVSPVVEQPTPSKTIRIKRPESTIAPESAAEPATAATVTPANTDEQKTVSVTQKKTLRLARPGGTVRPAGKFKKPVVAAAKSVEKPAGDDAEVAEIKEEPGTEATVANDGETVMTAIAPAPVTGPVKPDVPPAVAVIGLLLQIAACGVMGFVGWLLYQNTLYPAGWCF